MKVNITYHDLDSLTVEEVVRQATHNYGKNCKVEIAPESWIAYDSIYFGLQQLMTHQQINIMCDKSSSYHAELKKLRHEILNKVEEIIDQVIIDNESKL